MFLGEGLRAGGVADLPVEGDDGTEYVVEFNIDVTSQQRAQRAIEQTQRAEAENVRLQEEIIRMQAEALRALSTPLIPIAASASTWRR